MAEPLKNQYGAEVVHRIAEEIRSVCPTFVQATFLREALNGYETLELMDRGRHIMRALHRHLPSYFAEALSILLDSLGPRLADTHSFGMAPFHYLPHVLFVGTYGPPAVRSTPSLFSLCMSAQYELTQRFTAEFSMRYFLREFPEQTLRQLGTWAYDTNEHVRRLVSESTRPRLPWAMRLPAFQANPAPVIELLDKLKDDPSPYVRRSVANNLNDIYKDNPDVVIATLTDWQAEWKTEGSTPSLQPHRERVRLLRHALRSGIKAGHPEAFRILGVDGESPPNWQLENVCIEPSLLHLGESVEVSLTLRHNTPRPIRLIADLAVDYVRRPQTSGDQRYLRKVFRLCTTTLPPEHPLSLHKVIAIKAMSTRQHYPGKHPVHLLLNGQIHSLGSFTLLP